MNARWEWVLPLDFRSSGSSPGENKRSEDIPLR